MEPTIVSDPRQPLAFLTRLSGPNAGQRYWLLSPEEVGGRDPRCSIAIEGEDARVVSGRHFSISSEQGEFLLRDLNSTNGVIVNGERVNQAALRPGDQIRLGAAGPLFEFQVGSFSAAGGQSTLILAPDAQGGSSTSIVMSGAEESLLRRAVEEARRRRQGPEAGDHTMLLMRRVLSSVKKQTGRRHKRIIAALAVLLVVVSGYSWWRIHTVQTTKQAIDRQIASIEGQIASGAEDPAQLDRLIQELNQYQQQARSLQGDLFYRFIGTGRQNRFVEREIQALLEEAGAETYSVPREFVENVNRYIERYTGPDRPVIDHALGRARKSFDLMRKILEQENLPGDVAYMALVESAFLSGEKSSQGAAGVWQFTPGTARAYGLRVDGKVDERMDVAKSTQAAARYIRELILDFGSGSSLMLAFAAYNTGPGNVKQAVRSVDDPIRQRNFWYLYRSRALSKETREYVPKIVAAIIIGRNLKRFGF